MKVVALYRPKSEFSRTVEEYANDFYRVKGYELELVSLDTFEGADMARLYDIVQYPAILVVAGDGTLQRVWQGEQLPLMDEVAGYISGHN